MKYILNYATLQMYVGTKLFNHIAHSSVRTGQINGYSSPNAGSMQTPKAVES
jgi:hypothetical protein